MTKPLSKHTKAELIALIERKDAELAALRTKLSEQRAARRVSTPLAQRAAAYARQHRCTVRVHAGQLQAYRDGTWVTVD